VIKYTSLLSKAKFYELLSQFEHSYAQYSHINIMIKYSKILEKAKFYELLSQADIQSDMAQRIMFSILPHVSDKTQTYMTEGVVDYNALAHAISGRKDIIRYGAKACVSELRYEKSTRKNYLESLNEAQKYIEQQDYEKAVEFALKIFNDKDQWISGYGSKSWAKVASTLLRIIKLDKELESTKNYDQKVNIMKQLVVELNIFDGLSHNAGSILRNIVNEEMMEQRNRNYVEPEELDEKLKEIQGIMDAKELEDPSDAYEVIKETLIGSGDIHKFKEWISKLRQTPTPTNRKEREDELTKIRIRKIFNTELSGFKVIERLSMIPKSFEEKLIKLKSDPNEVLDEPIDQLRHISYFVSNIEQYFVEPLENIKFENEIIINVINKLNAYEEEIRSLNQYMQSLNRLEVINTLEKIIVIMKNVIEFMKSI
jgi:hypothetical protein